MITDDPDFIKGQLAWIPTRKEFARTAIEIIFGAAGLIYFVIAAVSLGNALDHHPRTGGMRSRRFSGNRLPLALACWDILSRRPFTGAGFSPKTFNRLPAVWPPRSTRMPDAVAANAATSASSMPWMSIQCSTLLIKCWCIGPATRHRSST